MRTLQFKRGGYLAIKARFYDKQKQLVVFDNVTNARCQINNQDKELVIELDVAETAVTGTYLLSTEDETSDLELGSHKADVYNEVDGKPTYSATFNIEFIDFETPKPIIPEGD